MNGFERFISGEIKRLPAEVRSVAGDFCSRGKRVRPMLVRAFAASYGDDTDAWVGLGAGVEFLHKASLIQDDLPCMDDSATRSGKPTLHTTFTPAHALLASDAMIGHGFRLAAASSQPALAVTLMSETLSNLCSGQLKDLRQIDTGTALGWQDTVDKKTGALFVLSARFGVLAAGSGDRQAHEIAARFGLCLGRLYQLFDDIVDGDCEASYETSFDAYIDQMCQLARQTPRPEALLGYGEQLKSMTQQIVVSHLKRSETKTPNALQNAE